MRCDVGEATEGLEKNCDVSEATEGLENEALFILNSFRRFTYVTAHSPTLPLLRLRHMHFSYVTWRTAHGVCVSVCCSYVRILVSRVTNGIW